MKFNRLCYLPEYVTVNRSPAPHYGLLKVSLALKLTPAPSPVSVYHSVLMELVKPLEGLNLGSLTLALGAMWSG